MATKVDRKNAAANEVNPEHSGIRSGNPQLQPDSTEHRPKPSQTSGDHKPDIVPKERGDRK